MNHLLDKPSLAVLIDCWSTNLFFNTNKDNLFHETVYKNISNWCFNNPYVQTVALATYPLPDPEHDSSAEMYIVKDLPWYENSKELFSDTLKLEFIRQNWNQTKTYEADQSITHEYIRNMQLRNDQLGVLTWTTEQIIFYCNDINPGIENIYFFGGIWDICVRIRPVGWLHLASAQHHNMFRTPKNFLTRKDCVIGQTCQPAAILGPWEPVDDQTYLLNLNHNAFQW